MSNLPVTTMNCPACQAEVPQGMRFCGYCGARVRDAAPQPELRQLTVLFCDLVGATAASEALEPEDLREVTTQYHAVCGSVIQEHEGYVAQYLGDGLVVYFGHPTAHEDDARRAVRAGLEINERLSHLSPTLEATLGVPIVARVGIHTGPVVIGEVGSGRQTERLALGKTPNLAARVQAIAEPGTVVITESTHAIVGGYFDLDSLGPHEIKGLADEVALYRVGRERDVSRLDVARRGGLTQLTGRNKEIEELCELWALAEEGRLVSALIGGEAGIGKSRIVDALRERIGNRAFRMLECTSSPYHQHSALQPVISLIERELGIVGDTAPEVRLSALEKRLQLRGVLSDESRALIARLLSLPVPDDDPTATLPPGVQRARTLDVLRSWLFAVASQGPLLWVFEDLHWTDPTTLELLGAVLASEEEVPLLMVLTHRPEFKMPWKTARRLTSLRLDRLDPESTRLMVGHVTHGKGLPEEVLSQVIERTEGVPLYVEEVTKAVLETGALREQEHSWVLSGPLPTDLIPTTVQGSLNARLDRLGDAKSIAQVAATIGREFRYDVLREVAGLEEAELRDGIDRLLRTGLVFRDIAPGDETYLFKHALIQVAAYQSQLKRVRRDLHRRIGDALSRLPDFAAKQPDLLAQHYAAAGEAALAVEHWLGAVRLAVARGAQFEVIGHCRRGLTAVAELPPEDRQVPEIEFVFAVIPALQNTAGWASPELEEFFLRCRRMLERIDDPILRSRTAAQSYIFSLVAGRVDEAVELAHEVLVVGDASGQPGPLFLGLTSYCCALMYAGRLAESLDLANRALDMHSPEVEAVIVPIAGNSGAVFPRLYKAFALWMLGYQERAIAVADEAIRIAHDLDFTPAIAFAAGYSTQFFALTRDTERVLRLVEQTLAVEHERHSTFWEPSVKAYRGWAQAMRGDPDGVVILKEGLRDYRAAGNGIGQIHLLGRIAEVLVAGEQWDEAIDTTAEAKELVARTGERYFAPELFRLEAEALMGRMKKGARWDVDLAAAETRVRQALDLAGQQGAKSLELRAAMTLCRIQQAQGDATEGRELLERTYNGFTEGFGLPDLCEGRAMLDELSRGDRA